MTKPVIRIQTKAKTLQKLISMFSAYKDNSALFSPLRIAVEGKNIYTQTFSSSASNFVLARFKTLSPKGEGAFIIDPTTFLSRMRFFGDENVRLDIYEDKYELYGKRDHITFYPVDESLCMFENDISKLKLDKDNVLLYRGKERPTTIVKIDASELQQFPKRASEIDVDCYKFHFSPNGSYGLVGDYQNRELTPIKTKLKCKVKGEEAEIILAEGFPEVINNIAGSWQLSFMDDVPMWMFRETEEYRIGYQIARRKELE